MNIKTVVGFLIKKHRLKRYNLLAGFVLGSLAVYAVISLINTGRIRLHYEMCDKYPNELVRKIKANNDNITMSEMEDELKHLNLQGGSYVRNSGRESNEVGTKVAIVVPYRDRPGNLNAFLRYMHVFLAEQNLFDYGIFIVEPRQDLVFNRALLLNVGFLEVLKIDPSYDCFIFHDVDMLPERDDNLYMCNPIYPKQFAILISIYDYINVAYFRNEYMGGVTAFTREQFKTINGYSNSYFGWGGEDDDVYGRCKKKFGKVDRLEPSLGRYFANCHREEKRNDDRHELLSTMDKRMNTDGLNSVKYQIERKNVSYLFTLFHVNY